MRLTAKEKETRRKRSEAGKKAAETRMSNLEKERMANETEPVAAVQATETEPVAAVQATGQDVTEAVAMVGDPVMTTEEKARLFDWLNSHGFLVRQDIPHGAEEQNAYENPGNVAFTGFDYDGPPDGFERILAQVSKLDLDSGILKVPFLQREGWAIDKVFLDGAMFRLKIPKEILAATVAGRARLYAGWLDRRTLDPPAQALARGSSGGQLGSPITAVVEPEGAPITTEQVISILQGVSH